MFQTFLNILGVIGIVIVAALVIVFLSDLFISIVDGTNGIFFKRNKGPKDDDDDDRPTKRPVLLNSPKEVEEKEEKKYNKDEEQVESASRRQPEKQPVFEDETFSFEESEVDYEKARREEEMAKQTANRQQVVNQRVASQPMAQPQQAIITPAPAPVKEEPKVEDKKENDEDIDKLIAEISKQTLSEIQKQEEENKATRHHLLDLYFF